MAFYSIKILDISISSTLFSIVVKYMTRVIFLTYVSYLQENMLHELEDNVEKEIAELKVTVANKDAEIEKVCLPSFFHLTMNSCRIQFQIQSHV